MSSIIIAGIIVALFLAAVGYAFISQNLEKKRKQKRRLLGALKTRQRNFKYMLSGFPTDFLTKELNILVYRCLVDVCEQLAKLEPEEPSYVEELQLYSSQMEEAKRKPATQKRKPLESPQQIKEVKQQLEELNTFIALLEKRGGITKVQADGFGRQIKQLVLQISVDNYTVSARQAGESGKTRLAIHFYGLARKLLVRESATSNYQKQVSQINSVISQLEAQLAEEEPEYQPSELEARQKEEAQEAWDRFRSEEDEPWKKKRVYD